MQKGQKSRRTKSISGCEEPEAAERKPPSNQILMHEKDP
jgi:hypothetical protein